MSEIPRDTGSQLPEPLQLWCRSVLEQVADSLESEQLLREFLDALLLLNPPPPAHVTPRAKAAHNGCQCSYYAGSDYDCPLHGEPTRIASPLCTCSKHS